MTKPYLSSSNHSAFTPESGSIVIVNPVIVTRKEKEGVGSLESDLTAFLVPLTFKNM